MSDQTPQHWIELFKDEEWNKFSQNETEDFSGKIIYTTEGAGPSIQMRFVTTQPRRGTRDTKGKRMEMSLMKPAKLTLVRPLAALVVRFVPFCGYA
jgi:hypothetical protein